MQQMANDMMQQMMMGGMQQMAEDAHLLRILLENVVHASHEQEALMTEIGSIRTDDPSLVQKIITQKEIADNFNIVRDSLRSIAMRQPTIQNFVFDELHIIENQTGNAMKHLNDLKLSQAARHQQTAMMSMNNLALMLAESLEHMENDMSSMGMGMPMQSCNSKSGQGKKDMKNMQQLQQQLSQQLKQMQQQMEKSGQQQPNSMSEQFARMVEEGRWEDLLYSVPIKPGDFFMIEPGTIHAIQAGTVVLETQQSSDVTYRVYDYDRVQADGTRRAERAGRQRRDDNRTSDDRLHHLSSPFSGLTK